MTRTGHLEAQDWRTVMMYLDISVVKQRCDERLPRRDSGSPDILNPAAFILNQTISREYRISQ
jgi:hypothetical protein